MSTLASNARWLGIAQAGKIVLQLASMAILARLLEPRTYGVMAIAWAMMNFAYLMRDMGTSTAVIRSQQLDEQLKNYSFTVSLTMGLFMGLAIALAAIPIAHIYNEPELVSATIILSATIPISAAGATHQALMERSNRFSELAAIEVGTQFTGLVVAIFFALQNCGIYSLVAQAATTSTLSTALINWRSGWRPKICFRHANAPRLLKFGGEMVSFNLVNYTWRNADSLILGKVAGPDPLGAYSMAYKLMLFPVQSITWVANRALLPVLSRQQSDPNEMLATYLKSVSVIAALSFPIMTCLWTLREQFVQLVFGNQWNQVAPVIAWLAPVGILQSVTSTTGTIFMATGRSGALFRLGLATAAVQIVCFTIGAFYSLPTFASFYFLGSSIVAIPTIAFTLRQLDASISDMIPSLVPPSVSATSLCISILIFQHLYGDETPSWHIFISAITIGIFSYLATARLLFPNYFQVTLDTLIQRHNKNTTPT